MDPEDPFPPFVLRYVVQGPRAKSCCSLCKWDKFCEGCRVPSDLSEVELWNDGAFSIDWNKAFLEKYFNFKEMVETWEHPSVAAAEAMLNRPVSFGDCMSGFTASEKLEGDGQVYCSKCKTHQNAEKSLQLWSTPNILVIHLKRLLPGRKLFTMVDAPLVGFDPTPYLAKERFDDPDFKAGQDVYDLYAVVNHYGSSGGGHYVALAKDQKSNQWFEFDDSFVHPVPEDEVVSRSAYMLFYQKRGVNGLDQVLPESVLSLLDEKLTPEQKAFLEEEEEPPSSRPPCSIM